MKNFYSLYFVLLLPWTTSLCAIASNSLEINGLSFKAMTPSEIKDELIGEFIDYYDDTEEQAPNIWNYDYSQIAIIIQSTKVSYLNEFAGFIYNVGDYPGYT